MTEANFQFNRKTPYELYLEQEVELLKRKVWELENYKMPEPLCQHTLESPLEISSHGPTLHLIATSGYQQQEFPQGYTVFAKSRPTDEKRGMNISAFVDERTFYDRPSWQIANILGLMIENSFRRLANLFTEEGE